MLIFIISDVSQRAEEMGHKLANMQEEQARAELSQQEQAEKSKVLEQSLARADTLTNEAQSQYRYFHAVHLDTLVFVSICACVCSRAY